MQVGVLALAGDYEQHANTVHQKRQIAVGRVPLDGGSAAGCNGQVGSGAAMQVGCIAAAANFPGGCLDTYTKVTC
jgi:hypothetical protein